MQYGFRVGRETHRMRQVFERPQFSAADLIAFFLTSACVPRHRAYNRRVPETHDLPDDVADLKRLVREQPLGDRAPEDPARAAAALEVRPLSRAAGARGHADRDEPTGPRAARPARCGRGGSAARYPERVHRRSRAADGTSTPLGATPLVGRRGN